MNELKKRESAPLFIVLNRYNNLGNFGPVLCWPDGEMVAGQRATTLRYPAEGVRTVTVELYIGTGVVELEEFIHLDEGDEKIRPLIQAARAVLDRSVVLDEDSEDCAFSLAELEAAVERFEARTIERAEIVDGTGWKDDDDTDEPELTDAELRKLGRADAGMV